MLKHLLSFILLASSVAILPGCAVVSVAGTAVATTVSVAGTVIGTTASVVGAGVKKVVGADDSTGR